MPNMNQNKFSAPVDPWLFSPPPVDPREQAVLTLGVSLTEARAVTQSRSERNVLTVLCCWSPVRLSIKHRSCAAGVQ
ncbi:unnamed protein product [Boreogadus saida]